MSFAQEQTGTGPSRRGFIGAVGAAAALSSVPGVRSAGAVPALKAGSAPPGGPSP